LGRIVFSIVHSQVRDDFGIPVKSKKGMATITGKTHEW
jgi:hypothetical protein